MAQEIEIKLSLPSEHASALWQSQALIALAHDAPVRRELYSAYYDTPDFRFRDRGVALRLRREQDHWVQTLKGGGEAVGGLHTRFEHETTLPAQLLSYPAIVEAGAGDLIDGDALRRKIGVVFTTEFSRTAAIVTAGTVNRIEVSLDRGTINAGRRQQAFCEIELELKEGDARCLFDLAEALARELPVRLDNVSKAERGYRLAARAGAQPVKATSIALTSTQSVDDAFGAVASSCLRHLQANETGVLHSRDPEYLHQARVAVRRLRSAIKLFSAAVPKPALADHAARLRDISHALGTARDWDVFSTETLPQSLASLHDSDAAALLRRRASAQRTRARRQVRELLASPAYTQTMLQFTKLLFVQNWRDGRSGPEAAVAAQTLDDFASQALRRRARKVRKSGRRASRDDPAQLHRLRIQVKKLRYACEFLASLYGRKTVRAYRKRLDALQQQLGSLNDAQSARRLLDAIEPDVPAQAPSVAVAYLRGFLAGRSSAELDDLQRAWARFEKAERFW